MYFTLYLLMGGFSSRFLIMGESWYSNHIASEFRPGRKTRVFYNKVVPAKGGLQRSCACHRWYCLVYMGKMPQHRLELKFTCSRAFQKTTVKFMNPYVVTRPYLRVSMGLTISRKTAKNLVVRRKPR